MGAGVAAIFVPQVAGIATGFAIIWALAWRRQDAAVAAIEERDGVRFYVDNTSPLSPIRPDPRAGLRRQVPGDGRRLSRADVPRSWFHAGVICVT